MPVVSVPATLANLGPGFDTLGMAVDLRNVFVIRPGHWGEEDLVLHTARRAAARFGAPLPPFSVEQDERIPRARGLGSSATARVAGLLAWRTLTESAPAPEEELAFLAEEEGHPDNVWPALLGGLVLCGERARRGAVHPSLRVALVAPGLEVPTRAAREALPAAVPLRDAVTNLAALAALLQGLRDGDLEALREGVRDRLHQPYRAPLLGPFRDAFARARAVGGAPFVSGSGSAIAAFCTAATARVTVDALGAAYREAGMQVRGWVLEPAREGARVEEER